MRQRIGLPLVQIMACRLFGAKPLSKPMLGYCQLDSWEQTSVKFESENKTFHSWNCTWKYRLRNRGHFVQREMSQASLLPPVCVVAGSGGRGYHKHLVMASYRKCDLCNKNSIAWRSVIRFRQLNGNSPDVSAQLTSSQPYTISRGQ